MGAIRLVRELAGPRKAIRLIISSLRIPICEDCLFSNRTSLITMLDFLSTLQRAPRFEYCLLCLGWVHCARKEHMYRDWYGPEVCSPSLVYLVLEFIAWFIYCSQRQHRYYHLGWPTLWDAEASGESVYVVGGPFLVQENRVEEIEWEHKGL